MRLILKRIWWTFIVLVGVVPHFVMPVRAMLGYPARHDLAIVGLVGMLAAMGLMAITMIWTMVKE